MDIQSLIIEKIKGETIGKIAEKSNLSRQDTSSVIEKALPLILGGLGNNAKSSSGAEEILGTLNKNHDGSILDIFNSSDDDSAIKKDGSAILNHIFKGNLGSINKTIGSETGVDKKASMNILESLAPIVMGQLGKENRSGKLNSNNLSSLLLGSLGENSSSILGLLDSNRNGSFIDEIMSFIRKMFLFKK